MYLIKVLKGMEVQGRKVWKLHRIKVLKVLFVQYGIMVGFRLMKYYSKILHSYGDITINSDRVAKIEAFAHPLCES